MLLKYEVKIDVTMIYDDRAEKYDEAFHNDVAVFPPEETGFSELCRITEMSMFPIYKSKDVGVNFTFMRMPR